ncbi:MAG TPA: polyprenyl synthetase family protein [Syntrophorhabdales bacterium]|nr:polyprenyl synthetase family protein [Syntrophorhabdales bacterium]
MGNISDIIGQDLAQLEQSIDRLLTTKVPFIKEVVHHIVKSGGKRIRPTLVILSAKMCGATDDRHIPYAAIIEFIHTATLLHDDVVDNAKIRRGRQTANTVWGNEPSVLVGDFLFTKSFDLMVQTQNAEILKVMANATTKLAEGEIMELLRTSDINTSEKDYYEVIDNKTAVLLAAACEIGAILGDVEVEKRLALREFGYHLGMAFQLKDDLLDYIATDSTLGKNTGIDFKEGKVTLPLIHALQFADAAERGIIATALQKKTTSKKDFQKVKEIIEKYGGLEYTSKVSEEHVDKARRFLSLFSPSPYKEALTELATYIITRQA